MPGQPYGVVAVDLTTPLHSATHALSADGRSAPQTGIRRHLIHLPLSGCPIESTNDRTGASRSSRELFGMGPKRTVSAGRRRPAAVAVDGHWW